MLDSPEVVCAGQAGSEYQAPAPSGEPTNAGSAKVAVVARARRRDGLWERGAQVEQSRRICSTTVMMVEPPGEPSASSGWPSSSTIVGLIELRGRLPPSTRFGWVNESKLKSVSSLLSRNPRPAPRRRCRRSARS